MGDDSQIWVEKRLQTVLSEWIVWGEERIIETRQIQTGPIVGPVVGKADAMSDAMSFEIVLVCRCHQPFDLNGL